MLNENPNNLNWKNKLDDVDGLSGEILPDKNAAWEKLHQRLQPKHSRINALWYWAAAACILLTIFISILPPNKKQEQFVKTEQIHLTPKQESIREVIAVKGRNELTTGKAEMESRAITIKDIQSKIEAPSSKDSIQKMAIISPELDAQNIAQPLHIIEEATVQDMPVAKVIASLGNLQKLKVVHVNELGDTPPEIHSRAFIADYRTVQIKLINQEVYTNASSATNNPGFNFFKTTNAPSN